MISNMAKANGDRQSLSVSGRIHGYFFSGSNFHQGIKAPAKELTQCSAQPAMGANDR